MGRRFLAAVLSLLALAIAAPGQSQDRLRIAAVVNDEAISMFDLAARLQLAIATSGLTDSTETRTRLMPLILRQLIEDRLKLQEARRRNIAVSDDEMARAVRALAEQNRMGPQDFERALTNAGVPLPIFQAQLRATLAWNKILERRLGAEARVSDEEIDAALARVAAAEGKTESRVFEIFLTPERGQGSDLAQRLVEEIRRGANFPAVARQFSQSATAAGGGEIGWVLPGDLEPDLDAAVQAAKPGDVIGPIATVGGVHILAVAEQRRVGPPAAGEARLSLAQILLPADDDNRESQKQLAQKAREAITSCADLARVSAELGLPEPDSPASVTLSDLSQTVRPVVEKLEVGQPSEPIDTGEAIAVLLVCERTNPAAPRLREQVAQRLFLERRALLAARLMRDLQQTAFIELRV